MSLQRDTAEELKMATPPIKTATRRFVYLAGYDLDTIPPSIEIAWLRWGGQTEFVYENADPDKVGIVIFQLLNSPYVPVKLAESLRPFYTKAGTEANTFEFDPITKTFTRRGPEWLDFPGRIR